VKYKVELNISEELSYEEIEDLAERHDSEALLLNEEQDEPGFFTYTFVSGSFDNLQGLGEEILEDDPTSYIEIYD
jgi:hypothetical protein